MKYLWIILLLAGVWFLVSAATPNGLLRSGHGFGRAYEIVIGLFLVAYAIFRFKKK